MIDRIGSANHLYSAYALRSAAPVVRVPEPAQSQSSYDVRLTISEFPSSPPPVATAAVDAAYERALDLAASDRELHFELDDETGRVRIQVRDLDGNVLRAIHATDALDVLAGAEL
jgi:flagellar protein FlaG